MNTTGIRIEVPKQMYDWLLELQEVHKQKTGKKTSLSSIIIAICTQAQAEKGENVQNFNENVQSFNKNEQNFVQYSAQNSTINKLPLQKCTELSDDFLRKWEARINERAILLRSQENDLIEARDDLFQKQLEFIEEKEALTEKRMIEPQKLIELNMLKAELIIKNEKIEYLQNEISNNSSQIMQQLKSLEKHNNKLSATLGDKPIIEKLLPWLPVIINAIGIFIMYNKMNNTPNSKADLSGITEQISSLLKGVNTEDKNKITKTIIETVQNFVHNNKKGEGKENEKL